MLLRRLAYAPIGFFIFGLVAGVSAIGQYGIDSPDHFDGDSYARTQAIVTDVYQWYDPNYVAPFSYSYEAKGQACSGDGDNRSPVPKVGSSVGVFYDQQSPCLSALYDPVQRRNQDLAVSVPAALLLALLGAVLTSVLLPLPRPEWFTRLTTRTRLASRDRTSRKGPGRLSPASDTAAAGSQQSIAQDSPTTWDEVVRDLQRIADEQLGARSKKPKELLMSAERNRAGVEAAVAQVSQLSLLFVDGALLVKLERDLRQRLDTYADRVTP